MTIWHAIFTCQSYHLHSSAFHRIRDSLSTTVQIAFDCVFLYAIKLLGHLQKSVWKAVCKVNYVVHVCWEYIIPLYREQLSLLIPMVPHRTRNKVPRSQLPIILVHYLENRLESSVEQLSLVLHVSYSKRDSCTLSHTSNTECKVTSIVFFISIWCTIRRDV